MRLISILLVLISFWTAHAADKLKWSFNNEEILKIIELYSKAAGQKFVVDPGVRGRISILMPDEITIEEAFNQLSSALAINGFAISKQGDTMVIQSARNIQRSYVETGSERPSLKPERMYTWIYTPKHTTAMRINKDLRIFPSRDGEMSVLFDQNQIILTDWVSNIHRVADILAAIDKPVDPATAKMVEADRKTWEKQKQERAQRKSHVAPPPPPKGKE